MSRRTEDQSENTIMTIDPKLQTKIDKLQAAVDAHELQLRRMLEHAATDDPELACAVAIAIAHMSVSLRALADTALGRLLQAHPDPGGRDPDPMTPGRSIRRRLSTRRRCLRDLVMAAHAAAIGAPPESRKKRIAPTPGGYPDSRTVTRPWHFGPAGV